MVPEQQHSRSQILVARDGEDDDEEAVMGCESPIFEGVGSSGCDRSVGGRVESLSSVAESSVMATSGGLEGVALASMGEEPDDFDAA